MARSPSMYSLKRKKWLSGMGGETEYPIQNWLPGSVGMWTLHVDVLSSTKGGIAGSRLHDAEADDASGGG